MHKPEPKQNITLEQLEEELRMYLQTEGTSDESIIENLKNSIALLKRVESMHKNSSRL